MIPKLRSLACAAGLLLPLSAIWAADDKPAASVAAPVSEIEQLKQMLADQQRQINELRGQLAKEKTGDAAASATTAVSANTTAPAATAVSANIAAPATAAVSATAAASNNTTSETGTGHASIGEVASTRPIIPFGATPATRFANAAFGPALPIAQGAPAPAKPTPAAANPCEAVPDGPAPAFIRVGSTCLVPIGFMDLTAFWRDKNAASSMGSNFGSVPYNNTANGNLSEFHFSEQNSRIGFRFDGDWKGTHFIGYNEFDFNGTSGSTSLAVSNGAIVPRLRLYWVDVRKSKIEFLAGQSWSMLVPNRNGISALPGDLFFTQVVDINYMAGLTWTRQPGMRVLVHPNKTVTFGFSVEQADQYIGGSAGGSPITLPSNFSGLAGAQLDAAQNISAASYLAQPTVTPDFIAKVAFDFPRAHFEVGGVESNFKTTNTALPFNQHYTTTGAGLLFGFNFGLTKTIRVLSSNFLSDGEGRYIFGQAPDLIVRADGSLSAVHSDSTLDGIEARVRPSLLLYAYYGGIYIGRNAAIDTNGSKIGYGYTGSPNSMNRAINEISFGFNQTIWASPRYGAVNAMGQYEWLSRNPWYVATGNPKGTHDNTIYFNLRYTLPGGMPNF